MMYYAETDGKICCAYRPVPEGKPVSETDKEKVSCFLYERDPSASRACFPVTDINQLRQDREGAYWLSSAELEKRAVYDIPDAAVRAAAARGELTAVNRSHPRWREIMSGIPVKGERPGDSALPLPVPLSGKKRRIHVLAIGDVGSNLITGLHLLGGDVLSSIGICDLDEKVLKRWEFEENQIAYPWDYDALPPVEIVEKKDLFDCDVFVFVASVGIPAVGSGVKDVRMAQFEKNSRIISEYAKMARSTGFRGLFCEVSDPVDPLAMVAFMESNRNESGVFDGKGLFPEQVKGFGLGVMNARAAYFARHEDRFASFLTEGRSFGPHGQELVIANSVGHYDDDLSRELTQKVVTANMLMREWGFKPFVAPAYSSGALSILLTLRGAWNCSSVFMGGTFMGVKNRLTAYGPEAEILPLPDPLFSRISAAEETLRELRGKTYPSAEY